MSTTTAGKGHVADDGSSNEESGKPAAKAPKQAGAKKPSPAEVLASAEASSADRVRAAKSLGRTNSEEGLIALASQLTTTDEALSKVLVTEISRVFRVRKQAGQTFDALPMFEEYLRSTKETPVPTDAKPPFDPVAHGTLAYLRMLHNDERPEVTAVLRSVAWTSPRGSTSATIRKHLVVHGDPESVERASWMLLDQILCDGATPFALIEHLPRDVSLARAKAQLAAGTPQAAGEAALSIFGLLVVLSAERFDAGAWWDVLREPLHATFPEMKKIRFEPWCQKHRLT
jgi:hypothetical protein